MSDGQQSASPPVASRADSSTTSRHFSRRVVEEEPRRQDKTYRRYASGIERALASFDTGRLEWPDYISFLGRLLKAIQAHPSAVEALPHKSSVANRLAQCLNPSLPSGVHQKAIEVYSYIFLLIGKDTLANDLAVYLPGLTSVLSFASLSLRPSFLSLIETHILALDPYALRPALKALILGLLPGLEDETSEEYDRTLRIVDGLKDAVNVRTDNDKSEELRGGDQHFWQCFFLATISNSARRQGSLAYLNKRLPVLKAVGQLTVSSIGQFESEVRSEDLSPDAEAVVHPEPGLLIRCFAAGLSDEQVLLQRGFLDLLLSHLPLDSPVLTTKADSPGFDLLMSAAVGVVIRRDMSLNRRLWAWLLGPDNAQDSETGRHSPSPEADRRHSSTGSLKSQEAFFQQYGASSLTRSLSSMFVSGSQSTADRVKPFRICLSLMDRSELGDSVMSSVFLTAMGNLYDIKRHISSTEFEEVLRSANSFFDGIEAGIIWGQLGDMFANALGANELSFEQRMRYMNVANFIISHFNVREEEMITVHVPLACTLLFDYAGSSDWFKSISNVEQSTQLEDVALAILDRLLQLLPETGNSQATAEEAATQDHDPVQEHSSTARSRIQQFYKEYRGNAEPSSLPMTPKVTGKILQQEATNLFISAIRPSSSTGNVDQKARLLASVISKQRECRDLDLEPLINAVNGSIDTSVSATTSMPRITFQTLSSLSQVLVRFMSTLEHDFDSHATIAPAFASLLVWNLWRYCSPSFPKYHVEAVRCLWQLDDAVPGERIVESSVSRYLVESEGEHNAADALEPARRFAVVWTHTAQLDVTQSRKLSNTWSKPGHSIRSSDSAQSLGLRDYQSRLHRPLLLLLDALVDMSSEIHYFLASWMQALPTVRPVLTVLISRLSRTQILKQVEKNGTGHNGELDSQLYHKDDSRESLYYLQHVSTLLRFFNEDMWTTLSEESEASFDMQIVDEKTTMIETLAQLCLQITHATSQTTISEKQALYESMQRMALSILQQLLSSPNALLLHAMSVEEPLIDALRSLLVLKQRSPSAQIALLDTITAALRLRNAHRPAKTPPRSHVRVPSFEVAKNSPKASVSVDTADHRNTDLTLPTAPPAHLMKCVLEGIASPASVLTLESWIEFLVEILPLFENNIFQNLIPLVECFCDQTRRAFQQLNALFKSPLAAASIAPEPALMSLLNGLEYVLVAAHDRLMAADEARSAAPKSPEPSAPGFFGNVVSGVFSSDSQRGRGSMANTRLTVILCFQDAIRICLTIWTWSTPGLDSSQQDISSTASFTYVSSRLRNKTRRILDRIFSSEPLESLETLVAAWSHRGNSSIPASPSPIVQLLHVLDGSKPKVVMPSIFNSIYSRTNSTALDPSRTSTLTSDLTDDTLARFLVDYTKSLEDDAMDEIWSDCMTFLKDVLSNPLPHHQVLPQLLVFLVTLTEKVDKTNFGEQRKMRKELGDLFLRLLTATFTAKSSSGTLQEIANAPVTSYNAALAARSVKNGAPGANGSDLMDVLTEISPRISTVLNDNDRLMSAASNMSTNIISPIIHSKVFPENLSQSYLSLLFQLSRIGVASKTWKRDIGDLFNSPKLFLVNPYLVKDDLLPIVRQWAIADKERITELCSRIASPTSGGMFGVGASAARLEADKKAQLNLRRMALMVMATEEDYIVPHLSALEEKLVDLLAATTATSPSSATRAELFMVLQALVLKTSSMHLASLWPVVDTELRKAISASVRQSHDYDTYNTVSLLQACKLLDVLVLIAPDEFQMHEWLFITDTVEAVYRPVQWQPVGLVDEIAEELGSTTLPETPMIGTATSESGQKGTQYKQPLLKVDADVTKMGKEEFISKVLRPFFAQLSIYAYEATYSMRGPDLHACELALLKDLFDDSTLMG